MQWRRSRPVSAVVLTDSRVRMRCRGWRLKFKPGTGPASVSEAFHAGLAIASWMARSQKLVDPARALYHSDAIDDLKLLFSEPGLIWSLGISAKSRR